MTGAPPRSRAGLTGLRVHVDGVVQGVGFRPFVYGLAHRQGLTGWVRNTSAGVDIAAEGPPDALEGFLASLRAEAPPLARIEALRAEGAAPEGFAAFEIAASSPVPGAFQPVATDVDVCADCRRELFDPTDRRFRYPFINCTHCGPRFTIIADIPYDRPLTTMAPFAMCPDCAREYADPLDRRFHAQPVACPACGPHVWLARPGVADPVAERDGALRAAQQALRDGHILAVKGLGGFHLACDATNAEAVARLRQRKRRVAKPFAVMMPDLETARIHGRVTAAEAAALLSRERPIVVLERLKHSGIAADCAPGQATLGVMLPYTPLHLLLFAGDGPGPTPWAFSALVMTSGNMSEEPIVADNAEALERLAGLADLFLLHDRAIQIRCDDSVVRVAPAGQGLTPLRRSRGLAPSPVPLGWDGPPLLAAGAELKNTFCLTRGANAFLSQHIGDMENYETLRAFEDAVRHFERLFRAHPVALAHDAHPDYLASRYAVERARAEGLPAFATQHHHAHIAAAMAEHQLAAGEPVIGLAFDGAGYGPDGAVWGGEFLICDYTHFERALHLAYVPLPGGDRAAREPWRMALSWLRHAGIAWNDDLAPVRAAGPEALAVMDRLITSDQAALNAAAPPTSSMGRLFDAAAALAGLRQQITYEAQAAIEWEAAASGAPEPDAPYPMEIGESTVEAAPLIRALAADARAGVPRAAISARFHHGLALMVRDACRQLRARHGLSRVVLSGGVWQNMTLLELTIPLLTADDFVVLTHRLVPANDGGLALGQAAIARHRMENG